MSAYFFHIFSPTYILDLAKTFFSQMPEQVEGNDLDFSAIDPQLLSQLLGAAESLFDNVDPKDVELLLQNFDIDSTPQFLELIQQLPIAESEEDIIPVLSDLMSLTRTLLEDVDLDKIEGFLEYSDDDVAPQIIGIMLFLKKI